MNVTSRVRKNVPAQAKNDHRMDNINMPKDEFGIRKSIGSRLREHRKSLGISQKEMADHLGVRTKTIVRFESGESTPGTDQIAALKEFDPSLSLEWLVMGRGEMVWVDPENWPLPIPSRAEHLLDMLGEIFSSPPETEEEAGDNIVRASILSELLAEFLGWEGLRRAMSAFTGVAYGTRYGFVDEGTASTGLLKMKIKSYKAIAENVLGEEVFEGNKTAKSKPRKPTTKSKTGKGKKK